MYRKALLTFIIAGLAVSSYLSYSKLLGKSTVCIGGHGGCDIVQNSDYAYLLGIPVAYLGFGTYLLLLALWLVAQNSAEDLSILADQLILGVAFSGTLFSAYLTYIELAVLNAICQWCVVSAILILSICLLAWRLISIDSVDTKSYE